MTSYIEDCQKPQFAKDMNYHSEMAVNMNKGGSTVIGNVARAHHSTESKDRLIEHTMRTERHDYSGSSVNVVNAPGIIGNSTHGMNFKFPVGKDVKKVAPSSPHKAGKKGEQKGGI